MLILDDEPAIRKLIRHVAEGGEHEVLEFGDVSSAASSLKASAPDLIFLDLELGSGDAIEAFRAFSEVGYQGTVQLMSGRGEAVLSSVEAVGRRYGFDLPPPLSKPFRVSQIKYVLDRIAKRSSESARAIAAPLPFGTAPDHDFTLEEAIDRDWLELWYQPKVDLRTGKTVGAEGLIRARHPSQGIVPPIAFLPSASDQSLARLTERVILNALEDWHIFHTAGHTLQLCVNAPASALLSVPIAQIVRMNRPASTEWPGLILELTEDQIVDSIPLAQEIAAQLKIYNVELSLDDFGQGHSSLARLRDLPFESLKIDRSFVMGCDTDPTKQQLCQAIVTMAHGFGCSVVAEGIETAAELSVLRELGCEYGQGYLLGRPMPREELIRHMMAAA